MSESLDALTITEATYTITNSYKYTSQQFGWALVLDGTFLQSSLTDALTSGGELNGGTFWGGYSTYAGEYFIPSGLSSSEASFEKLVSVFLPNFTTSDVEAPLRVVPCEWVQRAHHIVQHNRDQSCADLSRHHACVSCVFDPKDIQIEHPITYEGFTGAIASIVETGDPNTLKLTPSDQPVFRLLNATGEEYVMLLNEFETVELK